MGKTIGEILQEEADLALHEEFMAHARHLIINSTAGTLESFEGKLLSIQELVNAQIHIFSQRAGCELRPLRLVYEMDRCWVRIEIEPRQP